MIAFVAAMAMAVGQDFDHALEGVRNIMVVVGRSRAATQGKANGQELANVIGYKLERLGVRIVDEVPMLSKGGPISAGLLLNMEWRELRSERDRCYYRISLECSCRTHAPGSSQNPARLVLWEDALVDDSTKEDFPRMAKKMTTILMDRFGQAYRRSNP